MIQEVMSSCSLDFVSWHDLLFPQRLAKKNFPAAFQASLECVFIGHYILLYL